MATARKIILWFLGIAIVVIAILYTIGVNVPRIEMWKVKKQGEIYEKQVQEELNKYKNDFDGGKTPGRDTRTFYCRAESGGILKKRASIMRFLCRKKKKYFNETLLKRGSMNESAEFYSNLLKTGEKM